MPLDHLRHAIEPYVITSDYTLHVTGSDFYLLGHTSFYRIIYFVSLEQTSSHRIGLYVIGSDFFSLDRTLCIWIRNAFPSLAANRKKFVSQSAFEDMYQPLVTCGVNTEQYKKNATYSKQYKNGSSCCHESTGLLQILIMACISWSGYPRWFWGFGERWTLSLWSHFTYD